MEYCKSITNRDDPFLNACDEFIFYDCVETSESDDNVATPETSETSREISSPEGLRRRRPLLNNGSKDISVSDSKNSNPNSTVCLKENEIRDKLESFRVRLSSRSTDNRLKEEDKDPSTVTTEIGERVDYSVTVGSNTCVVGDSSSNLLLFLAGLVVKAIGFQISLLVSFFTFPVWFMYCTCVFMIDLFRAIRRVQESLKLKLMSVWVGVCENLAPLMYQWMYVCEAVSCEANCMEKSEIGMLGENRVIPPDHKIYGLI